MRKLCFIHHQKLSKNDLSYTLAIEPIEKSTIAQMLPMHANQTVCNMGVTIMSKKDKFAKKMGREQAEKRIRMQVMTLESINVESNNYMYYFRTNVEHNKKQYTVWLTFSTKEDKNDVRLIFGQLAKIQSI